jgi:hypothetical protein
MADALGTLCNRKDKYIRRYAGWIIEYGRQFGVDPFLLGALVYRQSRCKPGQDSRGQRVGLTRINLPAHRPMIRGGKYIYWVLADDKWNRDELDVSRFEFNLRSLRRSEVNIYYAAAILSIYGEQCQHLDAAVRSVAHRHHVSHFHWGDRVLGSLFEDLVLEDRRRLLRLYSDETPPPIASYRGIPLHSPLDGVPRKISSRYNDRRDHGRRHRGVDFHSTHGEVVRAAADGFVLFAGVDHPNRGASNIKPSRSGHVRRSRMGRGGIFVIIHHDKGFSTGYFHLARFTVQTGAWVKGGQIIGYVGRTGIKESPSHLHFEMRRYRRCFNPERYLRPYLVPREVKVKRRRRRSVTKRRVRSRGKRVAQAPPAS